MATTKKTLAEQVMLILAGGNLKPDRNIDIREVMMAVDNMRDDLCKQSLFANIKNGEYDIDADFLSHYPPITVLNDSVKNLKYITLPASRVALPKDMGLYLISPVTNQAAAFIPIAHGQQWMYKNTATIDNESNTFYYPVASRVYFVNIDPAVSEVLVTLVASSKAFLEGDVFPIPPDYEKTIIDGVLERFGIKKQIPHDENEDGIK